MAARLRKRLLKICFRAALKFHVVHFVKCWRIFRELNSKLYPSSLRKRKRAWLSCVHKTGNQAVSRTRTGATTAKKCAKSELNMHSCPYFCLSKSIAFLRFSLPSSSSLLDLPHHGRVREKFYEVIIQMKRLPLQDFQTVLFVFFGLIRTWLIIIESGRRLTRSVEPSGL